MYVLRKFDVELLQRVSKARLRWPKDSEVSDEHNPGCNHDYADLRSLSWDDARNVLVLEDGLVARIEQSKDPDAESDEIVEELSEDPDDGLFGLDVGVSAVVAALSAAGCVPFTSCNGGAFGGDHHEDHPLVAFFCHTEALRPIVAAAKEAGIGLENGQDGSLVAYAADINSLRGFARVLIDQADTLHPE